MDERRELELRRELNAGVDEKRELEIMRELNPQDGGVSTRGVTEAITTGINDGISKVGGLIGEGVKALGRTGQEPRKANPNTPTLNKLYERSGSDDLRAQLGTMAEAVGETIDIPAFKNMFGAFGLNTDFQSAEPLERIINRAAEEIGGTALPLAAQLGKAKVAAQGAGTLMDRLFVEPFRKAPVAGAVGEVGMSGLTGTGGGVGKEINPDSPATEFAGQVTGMLLPSAARLVANTTNLGYHAVGGLLMSADSPLAKRLGEKYGKEEVQRIISNHVMNRTLAASRLEESAGTLPEGVKLRTSQILNDPAFAAYERDFLRSNKEVSVAIDEITTRNNEVLREAFDGLKPPGEGGAKATSEYLNGRINDVNKAFQDRLRVAEDKALAMVSQMDPKQFGEQGEAVISATIKRSMAEAYGDMDRALDTLRKNVDPDGKAKWPTNIVKGSVNRVLGRMRAADKMTPTENEIYKIVSNFDRGSNFDELIALRERVDEDIVKLSQKNDPQSLKSAERLMEVRQGIFRTLDNFPAKANGDENLAGRYRLYMEAQNTRDTLFREGGVNRVMEPISKVADSEALSSLLLKGRATVEDALRVKEILKDKPDALAKVNEYLAKSAARYAMGGDGRVVPDKLRKWAENNAAILKVFPDADKQVFTLAGAQQRVDDVTRGIGRFQSELERSSLKSYVDDPDNLAKNILNAKNPAAEAARVMRLARRSPEAQQGLRNAFWDQMTKQMGGKATQPIMDPVAARKFISDNEPTLMALGYDRSTINKLRELTDVMEMNLRNPTPEVFKDPPNKGFWDVIPVKSLLSRGYSIARGVVSPRYVGSEVAIRAINYAVNKATAEQIIEMQKRLFTDPEFARMMMTPVTPKNVDGMQKKLRSYMINLVPTFAEGEENEDALLQGGPKGDRLEEPPKKKTLFGMAQDIEKDYQSLSPEDKEKRKEAAKQFWKDVQEQRKKK